MPNERDEPVVYFRQVFGETVPGPALPQGWQGRFAPALTLSLSVVAGQCPQGSFRAAVCVVRFVSGQCMALYAWIEAQSPPLFLKTSDLVRVQRIEPAENPALALDDGEAHDDRNPAMIQVPSLLQPAPPLRLVVLIADQDNGIEDGKLIVKIEDCPPGRFRVG